MNVQVLPYIVCISQLIGQTNGKMLSINLSIFSILAITVATFSCSNATMFHAQPQFTIKAEKNKAFSNLYLLATFDIKGGNLADCLGHCLETVVVNRFKFVVIQNVCCVQVTQKTTVHCFAKKMAVCMLRTKCDI